MPTVERLCCKLLLLKGIALCPLINVKETIIMYTCFLGSLEGRI